MAPIPLAIIGLSSSATTAWASSAHLPYLLSARGRARFRIVALCNSSVEAAQRAISHYSLPPETRAYGDPAALAADPDVRLVVVATRVDTHADVVRPSLLAGKDAFVEWPLAANARDAAELLRIAEEKGGRTAVGLQGRLARVFLKVKEVVESGRIGKVLSSEVVAAGGSISRDTLPLGLKYFTDREIGGNPYTIGFGHLFDSVQFVLGDVQNPQGQLQIQRPQVNIRDLAANKITETVKTNVPDLVFLTGKLPESSSVQKNASILIRYRRGEAFKDEPPFVWKINGEKGELRLTSYDGASLQASGYTNPVTIEIHDFESDSVVPVDWQWLDWQEEIPASGRSIATLYEAYVEGDESRYATFADALKRHKTLEDILNSYF